MHINETENAFKQLKRKRARGQDKATNKMLNLRIWDLLEAIIVLTSKYIENRKIPDTQNNTNAIVLLIKGYKEAYFILLYTSS